MSARIFFLRLVPAGIFIVSSTVTADSENALPERLDPGSHRSRSSAQHGHCLMNVVECFLGRRKYCFSCSSTAESLHEAFNTTGVREESTLTGVVARLAIFRGIPCGAFDCVRLRSKQLFGEGFAARAMKTGSRSQSSTAQCFLITLNLTSAPGVMPANLSDAV